MNSVLYCGRIIRRGVIWENWRPRLETAIWHTSPMMLAGRTSAENTSDHPKTGCHLRRRGAANWWGCSPDNAHECVARPLQEVAFLHYDLSCIILYGKWICFSTSCVQFVELWKLTLHYAVCVSTSCVQFVEVWKLTLHYAVCVSTSCVQFVEIWSLTLRFAVCVSTSCVHSVELWALNITFCSIPDTISALKMYVRWCRVWSVQRIPVNMPEMMDCLVSIVTGYRLNGWDAVCDRVLRFYATTSRPAPCKCNGWYQSPPSPVHLVSGPWIWTFTWCCCQEWYVPKHTGSFTLSMPFNIFVCYCNVVKEKVVIIVPKDHTMKTWCDGGITPHTLKFGTEWIFTSCCFICGERISGTLSFQSLSECCTEDRKFYSCWLLCK